MLNKAKCYEILRDDNLTEDSYKTVLKSYPKNLDALNGLVELSIKKEKFDEASKYLTQLENINPKDERSNFNKI